MLSLLPFGARALTLKTLKKNPHGVDLGALKPCLPDRLRTEDRRIHLSPEVLVDDVERLRHRGAEMATEWKQRSRADGNGTLTMIGRRQVRSNNSWMHNYPRLMKGSDRCTLLMSPDDAESLGLIDGATVKVQSDVGEVEVPLELTDAMMPGVVCMPHGFGHARDGVQLETASSKPGVSVNDLNDSQRIDELTGNAAFSGLPVTVTSVVAPAASAGAVEASEVAA